MMAAAACRNPSSWYKLPVIAASTTIRRVLTLHPRPRSCYYCNYQQQKYLKRSSSMTTKTPDGTHDGPNNGQRNCDSHKGRGQNNYTTGRSGGRGGGRGGGREGGARGRGRGGGRGRGRGSYSPPSSSSGTGNTSSNLQTHRVPQLFTSGGFPSMHQKLQAAKYKAHMPGCQCSKVKQVRSAISSSSSSHSTTTTTITKEQEEEQEKDTLQQPQKPRTLFKTLDGLVVLPDTKSIPGVYLCLDTGVETFQRDPMAAEQKLQNELFPPSSLSLSEQDQQETAVATATATTKTTLSSLSSSFKVNCAACLLEHQPNGFVCVSSSHRPTVDQVRDWARTRAHTKQQQQQQQQNVVGQEGGGLHSDHADYVVSLSQHTLSQWTRQTRTRHQLRDITNQILNQLSQQGIPVQEVGGTEETVDFGHHLKSLLSLVNRTSSSSSFDNKKEDSDYYWLVMVYDDRDMNAKKKGNGPSWTIDLPGGKRHLGETTFQGAIRETEEEISLLIDERWKVEDHPRQAQRGGGHHDRMNVYYFLTPPPEMLLMEQITENEFWTTPGL